MPPSAADFAANDDDEARTDSLDPTNSPAPVPLPPFPLPLQPLPAVSPSSSKTTHRSLSSRQTTRGLDLSMSSTGARYQPRSFKPDAGEAGQPGASAPGMERALSEDRAAYGGVGDAGEGLEEEVRRARAMRSSRPSSRAQTRTTDQETAPKDAATVLSTSDARDTASSRDNILALASGGRTTSDGSAPSLASFMGGGKKAPRLNRVGTGPTEDEREATAKLEREMAQGKWGGSTASDAAAPTTGLSLASLMKGGDAAASPVASKVNLKWMASDTPSQSLPLPSTAAAISAPPSTAQVIPSSESTFTATPASYVDVPSKAPAATSTKASSLPSSTPAPRSLADMLGSKASGPRLNSAPLPAVEHDEGPAHARGTGGGGVALPGMVAAGLVRERTKSLTSSAAPPAVVVEAKVFSRSPPETAKTDAVASTTSTPSASIIRLQASSIVSERIKKSEELQTPEVNVLDSPSKPARRGSVMDRWGRDEPNSAPSSPVVSRKVSSDKWGEKKVEPLVIQQPIATKRASIPLDIPGTTLLPSPSLDTIELPRADASPRFDSPPMDGADGWSVVSMSREPTADGSKWTGPPIGVKEVAKPAKVDAPTEVKHGRGVALPGLAGGLNIQSVDSGLEEYRTRAARATNGEAATTPDPSMSTLLASQYETTRGLHNIQSSPRFDSARPTAMDVAQSISSTPKSRPASVYGATTPKALSRPVSLTATKRTSRLDPDEAPRSPGASVRNAIAMWGTAPVAEPYSSGRREEYGVKVSSRSSSMDFKSMIPASPAKRLADLTFSETPKSSKTPAVLSQVFEKPAPAPTSLNSNADVVKNEVFSIVSSASTPLDHQGILYESELVAFVDRSKRGTTKLFVWIGKEAVNDPAAIKELEGKHSTRAVLIEQGRETSEMVNLVGDELVIRQGLRGSFDVADARLYSVRSESEGLFIVEVALAAPSICSGYCSVLSLIGEVFVWLGKGSVAIERQAAVSFANAQANGREVTVLNEGGETEYFWHILDGLDYAAASYWRFRPSFPQQTTVLALSPGSKSPVKSTSVSKSAISVIDAGYELWILCPSTLDSEKASLAAALDVSQGLASSWQSRSLPYRPPQHVLVFPSALPRDLPHLSRQLDILALNEGTSPTKINLFTIQEARDQLV